METQCSEAGILLGTFGEKSVFGSEHEGQEVHSQYGGFDNYVLLTKSEYINLIIKTFSNEGQHFSNKRPLSEI